jgi:hypothetical protein
MIVPEDPPGFIVRTELQKAAFENGFRLERGILSGWLRYGSTTVAGDIWLAGASMVGPWLLSIGQHEIFAEMKLVSNLQDDGPGSATIVFESLQALYEGLDRAYRLGASLPRCAIAAVPRRGRRPPARNRGGEAGSTAHRPKGVSRRADQVLEWKVPFDRHYRYSASARLPYRPVGRMRDRFSATRCAQRLVAVGTLGRRLRFGQSQFRR